MLKDGSMFLEIDMFKDVCVQPGDEITEQLHVSILLIFLYLHINLN